jgi:hypothetical protein
VKKCTNSAQIDKITEKRHFPKDFLQKPFNYSISTIYQQITIMKMEYIEKSFGQKTQFAPYPALGNNLYGY